MNAGNSPKAMPQPVRRDGLESVSCSSNHWTPFPPTSLRPVTSLAFPRSGWEGRYNLRPSILLFASSSGKKSLGRKSSQKCVSLHSSSCPLSSAWLIATRPLASCWPPPRPPLHREQSCHWTCSCVQVDDKHTLREVIKRGQATEAFSRGTSCAPCLRCPPPFQRRGGEGNKK